MFIVVGGYRGLGLPAELVKLAVVRTGGGGYRGFGWLLVFRKGKRLDIRIFFFINKIKIRTFRNRHCIELIVLKFNNNYFKF